MNFKINMTTSWYMLLTMLIWVGLILSMYSVSFAEDKVVTVSAFSDISMNDAVEQALRQAVEQTAGVFIHSESEMEQFILVKDQVLSRARGYITRYKVLKQQKSSEMYNVVVEAYVSGDMIVDDLMAMKILLQRMDRPKLMLLVEEGYKNMDSLDMSLAQNQLTALLIKKGFELVDKNQLAAANKQEQAKLALKGNTVAAKMLGLAMGAQYVVVGKAVAQNAGEVVAGTGLNSIQASIQIKVIQTKTGIVLGSITRSAASPHISPMVGAEKAFTLAAVDVVEGGLVDLITENFQDYLNNGAPLMVHVTGVGSYRLLKEVTAAVEGSNRVASLKKNSWDKMSGLLVLDLRFKGTVDDLAGMLDGQSLSQGSFEVTDLGPERLDLAIH